MFLSLDGTFWFQLINFAIFYAILNVVFLRPVGNAIKERRAHIDGVHSDFERYDHQYQTLHAQAEQKRGAARREADETLARARAEAEAEAEAIAQEQGAAATAIANEARQVVEGEMAAARGREEELSQALARTLLERAVGSAP
jgi:F0F1-type ATP synthase membrane subunit b/b'